MRNILNTHECARVAPTLRLRGVRTIRNRGRVLGSGALSVQGGGQAPQQGEDGLGAAFFDALELAGRLVRAPGPVIDAQAQGVTLVIDSLAEGQGLADGDPLRVLGLFGRRTQRMW